ncbi:hypothetical protein B7489_19725 [Vibrio alginolyticus]|nr:MULTISPECIES: hypothetical protein [Vibrio]EIO4087864.1 hypothetical protein [Vibrio parahaemolyticus]EHH0804577.1 hypothetical protein [Vibrio vulnificus]MBT0031464.1 hypothetical protein [Vibrio alginolyticus]MBT0054409.1 hypothetical protein [Vibrio alginolyticus]OSP11373.1 hypothetical protein B7489_19725 [Vibrio alginolyticus]
MESGESIISLFKLIAAVIGVVVGFFKLHALFESKDKLRKEYDFATKFFSSLTENESQTGFSYTEAVGYRALMGNKNAPVDEIKYVLELENSVDRLRDYQKAFTKVRSSTYSHPTNQIITKKFYLTRKYNKPLLEALWSIVFAGAYGVLALAALAPLLFKGMFAEASVVGQILWVAFFGCYSALFLNEYYQLSAAKRLVKASSAHIPQDKAKESI